VVDGGCRVCGAGADALTLARDPDYTAPAREPRDGRAPSPLAAPNLLRRITPHVETGPSTAGALTGVAPTVRPALTR